MLHKWTACLAALFIGIILVLCAIFPPAPKGADYAADKFSSARAMEDVRIIAAKPHPTGSEESAKVVKYLIKRLDTLGLDTQIDESLLPERALKRLNRWSGEEKTEQKINNVIGTLTGKDSTKPAVLLMAHHDTVWGSPGSADDTVGIASIFEIIRALNETGQQERDLIVLFTDGEEVGLSGARHFFAENSLRDKIGAVINFEARGGGGTANLFQTSADNGNAARLFARSVKQPSGNSAATYIYRILPNDTDLTPALERDYVAYNIANIGKAEYYHSPKIDAEALSESTLQHMGSQGLDLTRALLSADTLPAPAADATFFDAFGFFTIIYASNWGWGFIVLALILSALSMKRTEPKRDLLMGTAKMLGFLLIGGALLFGLNFLSGGGSSSDYYDRLAAIPKLELMVGFTCLAIFFGIFGRSPITENARVGAAIPLLLIAIAGQLVAPTAAYFISLGVLFCAIATFSISRWPAKKRGSWPAIVVTAVVLGYMLSMGHLLMLGVGPSLPSIAILPAAFACLAVLTVFPGLSKRTAYGLAVAGLTIGVVTAVWIRIDPIAATVPLY